MNNLWQHQIDALNFLARNKEAGWRGFGLFMGVATGKTRTALEFVQQHKFQRVLVMSVKEACRDAWLRQAADYDFHVVDLVEGSIKERARLLKTYRNYYDKPLIVVVNFDVIHRSPLSETFLSFGFDLLIADEAQRLKSPNGAQSNFAAKLAFNTPYRLALTGTPLHNTPLDIFGISRFLFPYKHQRGFGSAVFQPYGTWTKFREHFARWYGPNNYVLLYYTNQDELAANIKQWAIQIRREDVLSLPATQHIVRHVELEPDVRKFYKALEREYVAYLADSKMTASNALVKGLRLQQLTGGTAKFDDAAIAVPISYAKALELQTLVQDEIPDEESLVIFYRFDTDRQQIEHALKGTGRTIGYLNGERHELAQFQRGEFNTLIVQVQAGSVGVDLTKAHYCVIYSLDWSRGGYDQLLGRLERTTQKFPVVYFHIVAKNTVDELLYKSLEEKKEVIDFVTDKLRNTISR